MWREIQHQRWKSNIQFSPLKIKEKNNLACTFPINTSTGSFAKWCPRGVKSSSPSRAPTYNNLVSLKAKHTQKSGNILIFILYKSINMLWLYKNIFPHIKCWRLAQSIRMRFWLVQPIIWFNVNIICIISLFFLI